MKIHPRRRAFILEHPEQMTIDEELSSLLAWAEQQHFENVSAALRRVITKLGNSSGGSITSVVSV
jgi:hypothetical protein